ncbi:MAG: hypothetical protein WA125_16775 [Desulfosporosinus sp.]
MNNALTIASINNYPVDQFNRLFPATMTEISPLHKVMVNIVKIDTDPVAKDVYKQKQTVELSLTKIACLKLMTAANVIMEESKPILPKNCRRCVDISKSTRLAPQCNGCPTRDDEAYQVSILVPEPSGGYRKYTATKEVTKQDTLAKKNPLEHMGANCETKALLRALRAGLGLKGSYTAKELEKPFAVALVVLNTTDPELKAALIKRYAAGQDALFGGGVSTNHQLIGEDCLQLSSGVTSEVVVIGPDDEPNNSSCCECGKQIEPVGDWTVEMITEQLMKKFGCVICSTCQVATGPHQVAQGQQGNGQQGSGQQGSGQV